MTLRARVLVGMAVIAVVLAGSSYVITRSTEARLMDGVDNQLEDLLAPAVHLADDNFDQVVACSQAEEAAVANRPSAAFVGVVIPDGPACPSIEPNVGEGKPRPHVGSTAAP